jgi:hypothetical protein
LSYFGAEMTEFEVKTAKKLSKFFDVPYAKIDSTTTTLNRGNAILNKEVVLFSDTRDSLRLPYTLSINTIIIITIISNINFVREEGEKTLIFV